jgi:capsular polysaccharide transport system ATP-binding protein
LSAAPDTTVEAGPDGYVRLSGIRKTYQTRSGEHVVLDGLGLSVARGESLGIMGRNGAGKTTLTRIITGVEYPDAGRVERTMSISWPIGFFGAVQHSLSGADNTRFIARIYKRPIDEMLRQVEEFAELGRYFRMPVKTYSSGMFSRLAFGLSLAINFDCYVVDEVTGVGDHRFAERCHAALTERKRSGALIMISHDIHTLKAYCDRGAVLHAGKLTFFDSLDDTYAAYHSL